MKGTYSGEAGIDWHLVKEKNYFSGTPNECSGELTFANVSQNKVKIKTLSTQKPSRQSKSVFTLPSAKISLSARIPAQSESKVMASLHLPSDTPPGEYQASIACGKQKVPLKIEVLEHKETHIEPSHLKVQGEAGSNISTQLSIQNLGNTALDIRNIGMVWLRESDWIGRTLVYTLRDISPDDSVTDFGNRLLHRFHNEAISPVKVNFEPAIKNSLLAGSAIVRTLSLNLPTGIKKGRRYLGFIKINENRIWLEVYCTGSIGELAAP